MGLLAAAVVGAVSPYPAWSQGHAILPKSACTKLDRAGLAAFVEQWSAANASGSGERLASLYARDASVIALGTTLAISGQDNIRAHYSRQKSRGQHAHFAEIFAKYDCNETVVAGSYSFLGVGVKPEEGKVGALRYRMELVFREGQWFIAHHQTSYPTVQSEHAVKTSSVARRPATKRGDATASTSGDGGYKAGSWVNGAPSF